MQVHLLSFFCLLCLAFTAQAAPATAHEAIHHHHARRNPSPNARHSARTRFLKKRAPPVSSELILKEGIEAGKDALKTQDLSSLGPAYLLRKQAIQAEIEQMQNDLIQKARQKESVIHMEDGIHIAKYGQKPTKFPLITRWGTAIGLSAAIFNVFNTIFNVKNTVSVTKPFSAPPSPPSLQDTAGLWDGNQTTFLTMPSSTEVSRRSLDASISTTSIQPSHKADTEARECDQEPSVKAPNDTASRPHPVNNHHTELRRRWLVAGLVGAGIGAMFSPGFPSMILHKHDQVDKPPFDPNNPDMLRQINPYAKFLTDPSQPIPLPSSPGLLGYIPSPAPNTVNNALGRGAGFGTGLSTSVGVGAGAGYGLAGSSVYAGTSLGVPMTPYSGLNTKAAPVLRKREHTSGLRDHQGGQEGHVHAKHHEHAVQHVAKRFLFGGGPANKIIMAATLGSVVPLIYTAIKHSAYRQYNPRDRDIISELDRTPMYGAVGVPGFVPGQAALSALPGYDEYVRDLQAAQLGAQRSQVEQLARAKAEEQAAAQAEAASFGGGVGGSGSSPAPNSIAQPVLRKRDPHPAPSSSLYKSADDRENVHHLEKRNKWLFGGALALLGMGLGYMQSATMFPQDKEEEKDKKREKEEKAMLQQQMAQAQADGTYPGMSTPSGMGSGGGGYGYGYAGGYSAGAGTGLSTAGAGSPYTATPSTLGYGVSSGLGGYSSLSGSAVTPSLYTGGGAATVPSAANVGAGSGTIPVATTPPYQAPVLKKRGLEEEPKHLDHVKRSLYSDGELHAYLHRRGIVSPGFIRAMEIGGLTMFAGTLVANLMVGAKNKAKPVPYVTPNAQTKGPMVPGGDQYINYIRWKQGLAPGGTMVGANNPALLGSMAGLGGVPAGVGAGAGAGGGLGLGTTSISSVGGLLDQIPKEAPAVPVLKRRSLGASHEHRELTKRLTFATVEALLGGGRVFATRAAAMARVGASNLGTFTRARAGGVASGVSRFPSAFRGSEPLAYERLGTSTAAGEYRAGSAAMYPGMSGGGLFRPLGTATAAGTEFRAGTAATIPGMGGPLFSPTSESLMTAEAKLAATRNAVPLSNAAAAQAAASGKSTSMMTNIGIVSSGATVTAMMNGAL